MSKFSHSGNLIMAGFGVAILLMSFLVYKSTQQRFDLVTDNYYEKELVFQQQIDASKNTNAFDSLFAVSHTGNELTIRIPAELSKSLSNGSILFYFPADKEHDKQIKLPNSESGIYTFDISSWKKSHYIGKISFSSGGTAYYKELHIWL